MASIRQRGRNSWQITVSCGYKSNGQKDIKQTTVKRPEGLTDKQWDKQLDDLARDFEREVEKGTVLDGNKISFAEFSDKWTSYAEKELEPKTLFRYREMLNSRIIPVLGHVKLAKLQPPHLLEFYTNLSEAGIRLDGKYVIKPEAIDIIKDNGLTVASLSSAAGVSDRTISNATKGLPITRKSAEKISNALEYKTQSLFMLYGEPGTLSSRTILHHHRLISSMLTTAVQWQLITSNPAERVKAPKIDKRPVSHYDDEQTKALLNAIDTEEPKYKAMVMLDVFSGLRLGELMGLNWTDINFENNSIEITKASQYLTGKGTFEKKPKNEASVRKISIPTPVMSLLKEYRKWWLEQKIKCGDLWQNSDRLFVTWDGRPMFTYTLTNWFPEFLQRHNLPKITPHGLRHTMASLLGSQGMEVSAISKRLGHARISTTLDIYTHVFKKADTAASDLLEKTLLPNMEQNKEHQI